MMLRGWSPIVFVGAQIVALAVVWAIAALVHGYESSPSTRPVAADLSAAAEEPPEVTIAEILADPAAVPRTVTVTGTVGETVPADAHDPRALVLVGEGDEELLVTADRPTGVLDIIPGAGDDERIEITGEVLPAGRLIPALPQGGDIVELRERFEGRPALSAREAAPAEAGAGATP